MNVSQHSSGNTASKNLGTLRREVLCWFITGLWLHSDITLWIHILKSEPNSLLWSQSCMLPRFWWKKWSLSHVDPLLQFCAFWIYFPSGLPSNLNNVKRSITAILFVSISWKISFILPSNMISSITPNYPKENKIQCVSTEHTEWPFWPEAEITQTRQPLLQSLKSDIQLKYTCPVTWPNSPSLKNCYVKSRLLKWKFWYQKTGVNTTQRLWWQILERERDMTA